MLKKIKDKIYNLLRWSEKYTKTDMVYLANGGFWLGFGQVISSLSAFLLAIAFANLLPKEIYGNYKYILSIMGILLITNLGGLDTSLTRSIARGYEGSLVNVLKVKIKWSVLGSLASLIIATYYFLNNNQNLSLAFVIIALFIPFVDNLGVYTSYLYGKKNFKALTQYNNVIKIVSSLFIFLTIYFSDNLLLLLLAFFIPVVLLKSWFFYKIKKKYQLNNKVENATVSYGKKLSFISVISIIANQLDKILVFHYLGAVNLAIYSLAMAPTEQIKALLKNVQNIAFPKFAQKTKAEIKKIIYKKSLQLSFITTIIVVIYILAAPWLFELFFPQYLEAVIYSQILAISLVTLPIWVFQSALHAQQMTKQIFQLELINGILQIVLNIIFISMFGLWGAVIARIIYRIFNLIISGVIFYRA